MQPLQTLDTALAQVASSMGVDLMPGEVRVAACLLVAVAALHCCKSRRIRPTTACLSSPSTWSCSRCARVTAPLPPPPTRIASPSTGCTWWARRARTSTTCGATPLVRSLLALACTALTRSADDGQRSPLELACETLRWRHMAPTAPDTLPCYPYKDGDPFLLEHTPHLYFVGNQRAFQTARVVGPEQQAVRVVVVPSFSATRTVVLVDLASDVLHATPVHFAVQ